MFIDEAGKAKIALETDPEIIIRNFERYSKSKVSPFEDLTSEKTQQTLALMKYLTIGLIEFEQGETRPFTEVAAELKTYIKDKDSHGIHINNQQNCRERSN